MSPQTEPDWLTLLGPLPPEGGEWLATRMSGTFAGWVELRLVLSGAGRLRVVVAIFDAEGRPGAVSDVVATDGGRVQESVGARVEPDGLVEGTHWTSEGERHTPRPLTGPEREGVLGLAEALWRRRDGWLPGKTGRGD